MYQAYRKSKKRIDVPKFQKRCGLFWDSNPGPRALQVLEPKARIIPLDQTANDEIGIVMLYYKPIAMRRVWQIHNRFIKKEIFAA